MEPLIVCLIEGHNVFILLTTEVRLKEMVSMGIGSKPFMDIKPSDAAISDRAIDYIMKGSGELSLRYVMIT